MIFHHDRRGDLPSVDIPPNEEFAGSDDNNNRIEMNVSIILALHDRLFAASGNDHLCSYRLDAFRDEKDHQLLLLAELPRPRLTSQ